MNRTTAVENFIRQAEEAGLESVGARRPGDSEMWQIGGAHFFTVLGQSDADGGVFVGPFLHSAADVTALFATA
jgi:hypothetical protein